MCGVMISSMTASMISTTGDRRELGRYEEPLSEDLFGFKIGMMRAVFQTLFMVIVDRGRLKKYVKNEMPRGPRYFSIVAFRSSGPIALSFSSV